MLDANLIKQALTNVLYPGSKQNIVSLDMVQDIKIEDKKVGFTLIFQKSDDPNIVTVKKACVKAILENIGEDVKIKGNIKVKAVHQEDKPKSLAGVKNIIAISSGKGGVGKSTISSNLAIALAKTGAKVGLIDADIFGPSMPKMFNCENFRPTMVDRNGSTYIQTIEKYGVKLLSIGFFVDPDKATVWRGPMAGNALTQMINEGDWGELDYMLFDLPPGTSDIHLTLTGLVNLTGAIVVSTPQDVALADAIKGIDMFEAPGMDVPVLGLIENMSWFTPAELPENKYYIFGKDGCKKLAEERNIPLLGQIPIVQSIRENGDKGMPSALNDDSIVGITFANLAQNILQNIK